MKFWVVLLFEAEMGMISPVQMEELRAWLFEDGYDFSLIKQALREAVLNRKVSLNYIKAILRNWKNDGVNSLQAIESRQWNAKKLRERNHKKIFIFLWMDHGIVNRDNGRARC